MMKSIALGGTARKPRRSSWRRWARQAADCSVALLQEWRCRSRERADLARFDERMLRDIGVTPVEMWREINKPFWRK